MSENTELETIELSVSLPAETSPYKFATYWSAAVGRAIRPQMVYNYIKNNMIKASRNSLGHLVISDVDAYEFLVKQATKAASKRDEIEAQLNA